MERKKKKFRFNFLIYPKFQLALMGANFVVLGLIIGGVWLQTWLTYDKLIAQGVASKLGSNHAYFKFVAFQSDMLFRNLIIAFVIGFVLSTVLTIFLSHKLAGPLVRLKSYFKAVSESGEYQPFTFRKNDFFKEFPPIVVSALDKVHHTASGEEYIDKKAS